MWRILGFAIMTGLWSSYEGIKIVLVQEMYVGERFY